LFEYAKLDFDTSDESGHLVNDEADALVHYVKQDCCDVKQECCDEYYGHETGFKLHKVYRFSCEPMKAQTIVGDYRKYDGRQGEEGCSLDEVTVRIFPETTIDHRDVLIIAMI